MDINRDQDKSSLLVRACAPGEIIVNDERCHSNMLLSPDRLQADWPVSDASAITAADFDAALAMQPDLIILGTGDELVFPDNAVTATLLGKSVGFEVMDTRAACRTYNLLAMDGRSVVAALIQLTPA